MYKLLIIFFLLCTLLIYADEFDFIYEKCLEYGTTPERAKLISSTIKEEYFNTIYESIDPLLILALIIGESNIKNLYGDNGNAVGYFQLHQDAVWYVASFYPDIASRLRKIGYHKNLIRFPRVQIQIGVRYLYLILLHITNGNITKALNYYNRGNLSNYSKYVSYILTIYADLVQEYTKKK